MNTILFDLNLLQVLLASLGGCLLRYLVDAKEGKHFHIAMCIADCIAAVFLGYYAYEYAVRELHLSLFYSSLLNIIVGYVGADGVNIAKSILIKKVKKHFQVEETNENEKV